MQLKPTLSDTVCKLKLSYNTSFDLAVAGLTRPTNLLNIKLIETPFDLIEQNSDVGQSDVREEPLT
jgi:hypothetical protein